jgi:hypothetical protein
MRNPLKVSSRSLALLASVSLLVGILTIAELATATHGSRTLEVTPELSTIALPADATLTATISSAAPTAGIEIDWEIISGPGQTDTPASPDKECTIPDGDTTCDVVFDLAAPGTYLIMAWIDHDGKNETGEGGVTEADRAEGRYSGAWTGPPPGNDCQVTDPSFDVCPEVTSTPGNTSEPDLTDVVQVTFNTGPAKLDCDREQNIKPRTPLADSTVTFDCKVEDTFGNAVEDMPIDGENMDGANDPDNSAAQSGTPDYNNICTTDVAGKCSGTVGASEAQSGPAEICFWIDSNDNTAFNNTSDNDGAGCDTEAVGDPENDNFTDMVRIVWRDGGDSGPYFAPMDIARDIELAPGSTHAGYILKGTGEIVSFNGAVSLGAGPTFPFDIARDLERAPNGSWYILDGYGGVHPVGGADPIVTSGYWSGWDIAKNLEFTTSTAGYKLDGRGGVHAFGGAASLKPGPKFSFDIARDLERAPGGDWYILDGFGGIHPLAGGDPVTSSGYFSGRDLARDFEFLTATSGYKLDGFGGLHKIGSIPSAQYAPYFGFDIANDMIFFDGGGMLLDGYGGRHTFEFG